MTGAIPPDATHCGIVLFLLKNAGLVAWKKRAVYNVYN
jgi:hypothetical protein